MARPNGPRAVGMEDALAEHIAYERESRDLSYEALAKRMTELGCSIQGSAIYKIEKGNPRRRITVDELVTFARVFELSVEDLLKPMEVLKREWADRRLAQLDEARQQFYKALNDVADTWMDIYRNGFLDLLEGADEDDQVFTYLDNMAAQVLTPMPDNVMGDVAEKVMEVVQETASRLTLKEIRGITAEHGYEMTEGDEEGADDGEHQ